MVKNIRMRLQRKRGRGESRFVRVDSKGIYSWFANLLEELGAGRLGGDGRGFCVLLNRFRRLGFLFPES